MFQVGQDVVIKAGCWVHSQVAGQAVLDKWTKVQLSAPVKARIELVGDDGWLVLAETARKVRYRVWPTALEGQ